MLTCNMGFIELAWPKCSC